MSTFQNHESGSKNHLLFLKSSRSFLLLVVLGLRSLGALQSCFQNVSTTIIFFCGEMGRAVMFCILFAVCDDGVSFLKTKILI